MLISKEVVADDVTYAVSILVCDYCGVERTPGEQEAGWLQVQEFLQPQKIWNAARHFDTAEHAVLYLNIDWDAATPATP